MLLLFALSWQMVLQSTQSHSSLRHVSIYAVAALFLMTSLWSVTPAEAWPRRQRFATSLRPSRDRLQQRFDEDTDAVSRPATWQQLLAQPQYDDRCASLSLSPTRANQDQKTPFSPLCGILKHLHFSMNVN